METTELFREAQLLLMQGNHTESVDAFTKAIEAGADPFMSYLSRGAAYFQMKETDKAIADFTAAIGANDKNARAYYYRGMAYMAKEEYGKAIADQTAAIALKPDHGAAFFVRGTCYAQLGNEEDAENDLKTAITYSEAVKQGFNDTFGIMTTQFDGVMALLSGERKHPTAGFTEKETEQIKKWLEEGKEEA